MPKAGHVALAGAPNVGKSSLLNALVGAHLAIVSPKAQATRLPVVGLRTDGDTQYVFHDLPGLLDPVYPMQVRMRELALEALERMDVILHLHPASETPAPRLVELARLTKPLSAPVINVFTKADLVSAARREELMVLPLRGGGRVGRRQPFLTKPGIPLGMPGFGVLRPEHARLPSSGPARLPALAPSRAGCRGC